LILSFRVNNDPSLQDELIKQADQNEIANNSTAVPSNNTVTPTQTAPVAQPTQPGTAAPVTVSVPVAAPATQPVPTGEVQQTTAVQQPTNEVQP